MTFHCQVGIIGGGPAGSTAGFFLAQKDISVVLVEKEEFPRYCVGESLLPYNMPILRDMGVEQRLQEEGFQRKDGAVFGESKGHDLMRICFGDGLEEGYDHAYQVPRDEFDTMLLESAVEAGVDVRLGTALQLVEEQGKVCGFTAVDPDDVRLTVRCDIVLDCSGRHGFLGRKKNLYEPGPELDTSSIFGLFEGVHFPGDAESGDIVILAYDRGWFWFIPFADGRTSVGTVADRSLLEGFGASLATRGFSDMVARAGGRVADMLESANPIGECRILSRFNQRATPFSGPGWVLVGDSAMFVDPVFSAGVLVATSEAKLAAEVIIDALAGGRRPEPSDFESYAGAIDDAYELFNRYIFGWRDPVFREIFCQPDPDPRLTGPITTILAGGVFDRELVEKGDRIFHAVVERRRAQLAGG